MSRCADLEFRVPQETSETANKTAAFSFLATLKKQVCLPIWWREIHFAATEACPWQRAGTGTCLSSMLAPALASPACCGCRQLASPACSLAAV